MENYVIHLKDFPGSLSAWTIKRLPFQPNGWMEVFRSELKTNLAKIIFPENQILHATYTSEITGNFDIENILFYNVGPGSFSHLTKNGLIFESCIQHPVIPGTQDYPHLYNYSGVDPETGFKNWKMMDILAAWKKIVCPALNSTLKPHHFWHLFKKNIKSILGKLPVEDNFGINLKIHYPHEKQCNLSGSIKPIIDGIVSAFHVHDGSNLEYCTSWLTKHLPEPNENLQKLLINEDISILGKTNLIFPFKKGIMWNPMDSKCMACKMVLIPEKSCYEWSIDGEIFRISPVNQKSQLILPT